MDRVLIVPEIVHRAKDEFLLCAGEPYGILSDEML